MKLRKKQIKVPKNFSIPRWRFRNPSEEISDFLKDEASELSEGIGGIGAIGRGCTSNGCRDARSVRPLCQRLRYPLDQKLRYPWF